MKLSNKLFAALFATLFISSAAFAQGVTGDSDNISATTNVVTAITVAGVDDLQFGNILTTPGADVIVANTSANAGSFDISGGVAGATVDLTFTLPSTLTASAPDGDPTPITIIFSATDASRNTADVQGGATNFDPSSTESTVLSGSGALFVWLGGTLDTDSGTFDADSYSATITLAVDYN